MSVLVKSPMPGKLTEYRVKNGDKVNKGDILFILEAMKMNNEIVAEEDGIISDIDNREGQPVKMDDIIMKID
jgi:biotin carboxyl carrier protein